MVEGKDNMCFGVSLKVYEAIFYARCEIMTGLPAKRGISLFSFGGWNVQYITGFVAKEVSDV